MYVFIGLVYSEHDAQRVLQQSKIGLQGSANNYQWALIRGIHGVTGEKVCVLNSVPMGTFPRYCNILLEKAHFEETETAAIDSHGYVNLPIIKQVMRHNYLYRKLKKVITSSTEPVTAIVYSLYNPYLKALAKLKKENEKFNYILIVPDIPGNYGAKLSTRIKTAVVRMMGNQARKLSSYADGYVLLTEQMTEPLMIGKKPYVVVEGICNNEVVLDNKRERHAPQVLYTGVCDNGSGLDILVGAFAKLTDYDVQLLLAGPGDQKNLEQICKDNPNISYLGYLPREQVIQLQRRVSVLVNPRSAEAEHTQYSFPSKTMEYLSTGVPVVMNKLPGIPKEYHEHLFFAEHSNADSLAKKIQEILQMDEEALLEHGNRAARFIRDEKSSVPQAKKVIKLVEQLRNN